MNKYIDAIRQNVCAVCVDSTEEGNCTLNKNELCAVEYFLPEIVAAIHSIDSEYMEDYHKELREKVCGECKNSSDEDNCYLREDANCSVDRYYSLIVETVKKVDSGEIN